MILVFCNRIKNKSGQLADKVNEKKNELRDQSQKVFDKIYPSFDHDKPDTENNKNRFKEFLKIKISEDIKNIYCFNDEIGIDADYMFAFNCNETTSKKIIEVHELLIDSLNSDNGFGIQHDFEWWEKDRIVNLEKYTWTDGKQYFKYYWYDKENKKAYFFDFDL